MARSLAVEDLAIVAPRREGALDVVHDVSFTLTAGRVLALVGASGSGKSATCLGMQDALPPGLRRTGGRVLVDRRAVPLAGLRGRTVATVLQNPRTAFNPILTMRRHGREVVEPAGRKGADADTAITEAFHEVGLADPAQVLDLYPFQMSGGMLQRAMIALALLADAPFLIADEPTTDLDLLSQGRILDLLEGLVVRRGIGVLLVTHDMSVVARLADDVAVMHRGRIVERNGVEGVFASARHAATRALLAAHHALYSGESMEASS
ncbi:MAG: ATP-binding cassette domain-containing protein [Rhodospirillales bacterium]|nr:ATP-binding cassette domain-containing protein [Rhodospirillales bacterium]